VVAAGLAGIDLVACRLEVVDQPLEPIGIGCCDRKPGAARGHDMGQIRLGWEHAGGAGGAWSASWHGCCTACRWRVAGEAFPDIAGGSPHALLLVLLLGRNAEAGELRDPLMAGIDGR